LNEKKRAHSKTASVKTHSNEIQKPNLLSANKPQISKQPKFKMPTFRTPSVKKPSFVVSRLVLNMITKTYCSFIAEQFCMATAAPNNPVDHESQNLFLMTLLIFLIEVLFKQIMIF
jgi:hypothetical protein